MNIFGQADADAESFHTRNAELRELNIKQTIVGRWLNAVLSVFSVVGPALVFWYGGSQVIDELRQALAAHPGTVPDPDKLKMTTGTLVAFAALLTQLYRPLMQLATVYANIQASFGVFERIFEYLDLRPDVQDSPGALPLERTRGTWRSST